MKLETTTSYMDRTSVIGLLLFVSLFWGGALYPAGPDAKGGGADQGRIYYEMGLAQREKGDEKKAGAYFRLAVDAGGNYGDLARVEIIRSLAGGASGSMLNEIRAELEQLKDPSLAAEAWFAAVQSLKEHDETEAALQLALEMADRFPGGEKADDALVLAAEMYLDQGAPAAALEVLFHVMERYPESDSLDDAYYFLGRVYLTPGPFYSRARALSAFSHFQNHIHEEPFASSLWKEEVRSILKEFFP